MTGVLWLWYREEACVGEVLYFMEVRDETANRKCTFAVVAWMHLEVGVDGTCVTVEQTSFRRYRRAVEGEARLPARIVPIRFISALVHLFHDCERVHDSYDPEDEMACWIGSRGVVHSPSCDKWLMTI